MYFLQPRMVLFAHCAIKHSSSTQPTKFKETNYRTDRCDLLSVAVVTLHNENRNRSTIFSHLQMQWKAKCIKTKDNRTNNEENHWKDGQLGSVC